MEKLHLGADTLLDRKTFIDSWRLGAHEGDVKDREVDD